MDGQYYGVGQNSSAAGFELFAAEQCASKSADEIGAAA
jgi:hypothetical protein